jgi:hypothetical protein
MRARTPLLTQRPQPIARILPSTAAELAGESLTQLEARAAALHGTLADREALVADVTAQLRLLHETLSTWEGFAKLAAASP